METKTLVDGTCPECRGPLTEIQEDNLTQLRCLVGHMYSPVALLAAHSETQERALWSAVVALEEAANIVGVVAPSMPADVVSRLEAQARKKREQAAQIRRILDDLDRFQVD